LQHAARSEAPSTHTHAEKHTPQPSATLWRMGRHTAHKRVAARQAKCARRNWAPSVLGNGNAVDGAASSAAKHLPAAIPAQQDGIGHAPCASYWLSQCPAHPTPEQYARTPLWLSRAVACRVSGVHKSPRPVCGASQSTAAVCSTEHNTRPRRNQRDRANR